MNAYDRLQSFGPAVPTRRAERPYVEQRQPYKTQHSLAKSVGQVRITHDRTQYLVLQVARIEDGAQVWQRIGGFATEQEAERFAVKAMAAMEARDG